ncbi:MAG: hypothetical protein ACOCUI_02985 [bacterium]
MSVAAVSISEKKELLGGGMNKLSCESATKQKAKFKDKEKQIKEMEILKRSPGRTKYC